MSVDIAAQSSVVLTTPAAISSAAEAVSSIAASVSSVVYSSISEAQQSRIQQQPTQTSYSTITVEASSIQVVTASVAAPSLPPTTYYQTSIVTVPAPLGGGQEASTLVVTVTSAPPTTAPPVAPNTPITTTTAAPTSATAATLQNNGTSTTSSGGLSAGGKTAVAVVVPVVVVALLVLAAILLWRRRKNKKTNEEARRKEVEDYNFNPNDDPTLPPVTLTGGSSPPEMVDGAGYRGWGNSTNPNRKASTTVSGPVAAAAMSEFGSANNTSPGSPIQGPQSDHHSSDPLVAGGTVSGTTSVGRSRRETMDSETITALGAAPLTSNNRSDIRRGPSNASSSYSAANRSEESGEHPLPVGSPQDYPLTNYASYGQPMPYEDPMYTGSQQPVVRDVPARRNTRIENPVVFPQQGNAGIAQNF